MSNDVLRRLEHDIMVTPEIEEALLQLNSGFRSKGVELIVQSGELTQGELCWLCVGMPAYRREGRPAFRACIHCLDHDREQASKLGFKMLLPLMEFPFTPRIKNSQVTLGERLIEKVGRLWSEVSILDEWRGYQYRHSLALHHFEDRDFMSVWDWAAYLDFGPERSRNAWRTFVADQHPEILGWCDELPAQRWWRQGARRV